MVGEIFHKAGVEHVVCIDENCKISEEAAKKFASMFYASIFN